MSFNILEYQEIYYNIWLYIHEPYNNSNPLESRIHNNENALINIEDKFNNLLKKCDVSDLHILKIDYSTIMLLLLGARRVAVQPIQIQHTLVSVAPLKFKPSNDFLRLLENNRTYNEM